MIAFRHVSRGLCSFEDEDIKLYLSRAPANNPHLNLILYTKTLLPNNPSLL